MKFRPTTETVKSPRGAPKSANQKAGVALPLLDDYGPDAAVPVPPSGPSPRRAPSPVPAKVSPREAVRAVKLGHAPKGESVSPREAVRAVKLGHAPKTEADASADMRRKLAESLLDDPATIKSHGFEALPMTPDGCKSVRGILIPYFDVAGLKTGFWRYRYLDDPRSTVQKLAKDRASRYYQPRNTSAYVYFAPSLNWTQIVKDSRYRIVVTEGEFKAACACLCGVATLGLGGVWNFAEVRENIRTTLPQLEGVDWKGRDVVVCYDSDAVRNLQVRQAEFRVCEALAVLGANVRVARLPEGPDGHKCGLDDFLAAGDLEVQKAALEVIFEAAEPFAAVAALMRLNLELAVVLNPDTYYAKHTHVPGGFLEPLDVGTARTSRAMGEALAAQSVVIPDGADKNGNARNVVQPLFLTWRTWPGRTVVRRLGYQPGSYGIVDGVLNTWSGWGVDPVTDEQLAGAPLDVEPWQRLLDIVLDGASPDVRHWFECWLAYPFQFPGAKILSCVILASRKHGIGKSFISEIMARIHGRSGDSFVRQCLNGNPNNVNAAKIDLNAVIGGRNDWARARTFAFGEDVRGTTASESREMRDQLKDAVTRSTVRVDEKYMKPIEYEDRCNLMFSTNDPSCFQIDDEDRRFFVWESEAAPRDREFYMALDRWSKSVGPAHLHRYFLELDLKDFDPSAHPPETSAKCQVQSSGDSWVLGWCRDLHDSPETALRGEFDAPIYKLYTLEDLAKIYDPERTRDVSRNLFARSLHDAGIPQSGYAIRMADGRQRFLYAPFGMPEGREGISIGTLYRDERMPPGVRLSQRGGRTK